MLDKRSESNAVQDFHEVSSPARRTAVADRVLEKPPEAAPWGVEQLIQMHLGFAPARILQTAAELDVFSGIAAGRITVAQLSEAAGATERGLRMVLDALVGMQMLVKFGNSYGLTEMARRFLVRGSEDYLGDFLAMNDLWESWNRLTEVVRTGRPSWAVERKQAAEEFFPRLVRGLHVIHREPARRAAEALGAGRRRNGLRVLDVACGSGIWGIAIAEADPEARVTAQDFPGVLPVTREYVERHHLTGRFDFQAGDLKDADYGEARYDLAILANIVHSEGERSSRDLFRRVFRALRPGGRVAIADMIPNDDRTGPVFQLIFALNMLVNSEFGDTYTLAEYHRWLREAGFTRMDTADIGSHSPLVVGHKP
jgi:ubiquinone/menaquinone biosynthesis C-methylase UbiE